MGDQGWDPLKELASVQRRLNQLFDAAIARTDYSPGGEADAWVPTADVVETEDRWVAVVELPGVEPQTLEVRIEADGLVVEGEKKMASEANAVEAYHRVERSYGRFHRRFPLPSGANRGEASATYRNGLLTVTVHKGGSPHTAVHVPIR